MSCQSLPPPIPFSSNHRKSVEFYKDLLSSRKLAFRSAAARLFAREPWRHWGLSFYERAATDCAQHFQRHAAVERVWIVGGSVNRCRPGISDLDFVVFLRDGLSAGEEIETTQRLRHGYRALKRRWRVLGEVHLTSPRRWKTLLRSGPAPILWSSPYRELDGARWSEIRDLPRGIVGPHGRFALSQAHYTRACLSLARLLRGSHVSFERAQFQKELAKCLALANDEPVRLLHDGCEAALLREAFLSLDRLAREATKTPVSRGPDLTFERWKEPPAPALEAASEHLRGTFNRLLERADEALPMEFPLHFQLSVPVPSTFARYEEALARLAARIPGFFLLSEAMGKCLSEGWAWEKPLQSLPSLQASFDLDPAEGNRRLKLLARGFWERLVFHGSSLMEFALYDAPATRNTVLKHLCWETLFLVTGKVSDDGSALASEARSAVPHVARLWESLERGRLPWREDQYAESAWRLRQEIDSALKDWSLP